MGLVEVLYPSENNSAEEEIKLDLDVFCYTCTYVMLYTCCMILSLLMSVDRVKDAEVASTSVASKNCPALMI